MLDVYLESRNVTLNYTGNETAYDHEIRKRGRGGLAAMRVVF
jgi:hypothetical protein